MRKHGENDGRIVWRKSQYNGADVNKKIIINLRDLSHTMRSLYEGKGSQKRILIVLDESDSSITQRELTERLGIQPGSASEVIAKLESAGYIKRTPSEMDRRTTDIALTETGKISASEARKQRERRHEEMFSCLSDEEKNELLLLLEKINEDWENRYHADGKKQSRCEHRHGSRHEHGAHKKQENKKQENNQQENGQSRKGE